MPRRRDADVAIRSTDLSIARPSRGGPDIRVIDGVSFVLEHAATLAVMGPTGSGKSSLLAVLAGSDEPGLGVVGGSAHVEGIGVRNPGRAHRTLTYLTGYMSQSAGARLPSRDATRPASWPHGWTTRSTSTTRNKGSRYRYAATPASPCRRSGTSSSTTTDPLGGSAGLACKVAIWGGTDARGPQRTWRAPQSRAAFMQSAADEVLLDRGGQMPPAA